MRTLKRSLDQSFKGVEELNCPICMDYIVSCRTAICGHSFCEMCISESMIHRKECPNCRKDIRKWVLSKSEIIDSAVKLMVSSKAENDDNAEELQRYKERVKAHEEWLSKQSVEPIKPGEKVDALDTEYIWCRAQVELKIQARGRKPLLYLHYEVRQAFKLTKFLLRAGAGSTTNTFTWILAGSPHSASSPIATTFRGTRTTRLITARP